MARRVMLALYLCAALAVSAADAPPAPLRVGALCIGSHERVSSSDCSDRRTPDVAYLLRTSASTAAAHLQNGQVQPAESLREVTFALTGEGKRWPAATAIALADGKTNWQWSVGAGDVRKKQTVQLLPGEYRLTITAAGHQPFERAVTVPPDLPRVDFATVVLAASRSVSGVVVDPERRAVAGCAVLADGLSLAFTDARGRFDAELPVPAPRSVTLTHPQFAPRVLPILLQGDTALGTVQLFRGGSIACTVDRTAIVEKKIFAELYQFVPGEAFRRRHSTSLDDTSTVVRFDNLEPGDYGLLLKGDKPLEQLVVPVTVTEGAVSEVGVAIVPWRLHVTAARGDEPLAGATVRLLNSGTLERRVWNPEIRLDATGAATANVWQRGRIDAELHSEKLHSIFLPASLMISTDEDRAEWNITVPQMLVQGTVVDDATGEPVAGARVIHQSESVSGAIKATGSDGRFAFDVFDEGRHSFRVDASEYLPSERIDVTFHEAVGERQLEFRLKKGKTISLDVRDVDGRPIAGAVVIDGCAAGMRSRGFRTAADGSLALPSSGGRHHVCVLPMQGAFALADVEPSAEPSAPPVQIRVPPPQVTMRISAKTADRVPVAQLGILLVHNGRVVPPVVVQTIAELQRRFARTDQRGELLLAGMPAGHYDFFVYTTDEEAVSIATDRRNATPVYSGYLAPGEAALDLTIEARD